MLTISIYIYIQSRCTCEEAAILCLRVSTVVLNVDLLAAFVIKSGRHSWYKKDTVVVHNFVIKYVINRKPGITSG